jgi:hypothetical protein
MTHTFNVLQNYDSDDAGLELSCLRVDGKEDEIEGGVLKGVQLQVDEAGEGAMASITIIDDGDDNDGDDGDGDGDDDGDGGEEEEEEVSYLNLVQAHEQCSTRNVLCNPQSRARLESLLLVLFTITRFANSFSLPVPTHDYHDKNNGDAADDDEYTNLCPSSLLPAAFYSYIPRLLLLAPSFLISHYALIAVMFIYM